MFKVNKKVVAGLAAGAVVVAGGGVAYAYWTTTGTGSGQSTSTATPAGVTYHAAFTATSLAPGSTPVVVTFSATNASPTILQVPAPTATISSNKTVDGLAMADDKSNSCAQYLSLDAAPTGGQVPAHTAGGDGSVGLGTANLSFADSTTDDQSKCEGQTITISLGNS